MFDIGTEIFSKMIQTLVRKDTFLSEDPLFENLRM